MSERLKIKRISRRTSGFLALSLLLQVYYMACLYPHRGSGCFYLSQCHFLGFSLSTMQRRRECLPLLALNNECKQSGRLFTSRSSFFAFITRDHSESIHFSKLFSFNSVRLWLHVLTRLSRQNTLCSIVGCGKSRFQFSLFCPVALLLFWSHLYFQNKPVDHFRSDLYSSILS